jgi:SAM-dependent methyltransferase
MKDEVSRLDGISSYYKSNIAMLNKNFISYYTFMLVKEFMKPGFAIQMGIGDGYSSRELKHLFSRFLITEGSKRLVEEHAKNFEIVQCMFEDFVPDEKCDTIICTHVLEHVENPIDVLKQVRTWIKDDGILIVTIPNANSLHRRIGVAMGLISDVCQLSDMDKRVGHRRVYTIQDIKRDLHVGGFIISQLGGYMVKSTSYENMGVPSKSYLDACYKVSRTLPPDICSSLVAICTKSPRGIH